MNLTIKHKKQLTIPNDPAALAAGDAVSSDWNDVHTVTGTLDLSTDVTGNLAISHFNSGTNATSPNAFWGGDGTWKQPATGGIGQPGGSNTQVQYNGIGILSGDANFTWTKANPAANPPTTGLLSIGGGQGGLAVINGATPSNSGDPNLLWGAKIATTFDDGMFTTVNSGFTAETGLRVETLLQTGGNYFPGNLFGGTKKTFSSISSTITGNGAGQKFLETGIATFRGMGDSALQSKSMTFAGGPIGGDEAQGFTVVERCFQQSAVDVQYITAVQPKSSANTITTAALTPSTVAQSIPVVSSASIAIGDFVVIDHCTADTQGVALTNVSISAPATPAVVSKTNHGFSINQQVVFGGTLPGGIVAATPYWIAATGFTANSFSVTATPGGALVNTTGVATTTATVAANLTSTTGLPNDEVVQVTGKADTTHFTAVVTLQHVTGVAIKPATVLNTTFVDGMGEQRFAVVHNGPSYSTGQINGVNGYQLSATGANFGGPTGPLTGANSWYALGAISLDSDKIDNTSVMPPASLPITNPYGNGAITSLGAVVGGSGYTPLSGTATYNGVALTGGTGKGATANIRVTNGAVDLVTLVSGGSEFQPTDTLSAAASSIGGTGSGFSVPVGTSNTPTGRSWFWIMGFPDSTHVNVMSNDVTGSPNYKGIGATAGSPTNYIIRPALRIIRTDTATGFLLCGPSDWTLSAGQALLCPVCAYPDVNGFDRRMAVYLPGATSRYMNAIYNRGFRQFLTAYWIGGWSSPIANNGTQPVNTASADAYSFGNGFQLFGASCGLQVDGAGNGAGFSANPGVFGCGIALTANGTAFQYPRSGHIVWSTNDFNGNLGYKNFGTGPVATTGASGAAGTATITFAAQPSAPPVGAYVVVSGVTPTGYNGNYPITASTTTSVSYANATTGAQTVAGTVQVPVWGMAWFGGGGGTLNSDTATISLQPYNTPGTTDLRSRMTWPSTFAVGRIVSSQTDTIGIAPDVTGSLPLISMSQAWNNVATAFDLLLFTFTNTASAAGSNLLRFNNGSADVFKIGPTGATTIADLFTTNGYIRWAGEASVAADFSVTSSVALTNVTGLSVNVTAGRTYRFNACLIVKSMATAGGVQAAIGGTATATNIIYDGYAMDTGASPVHGYAQAAALGGAVASFAGFTATFTTIVIRGMITVNAGGTLTVQFAQNTSNATASVVARGSFFEVHDSP